MPLDAKDPLGGYTARAMGVAFSPADAEIPPPRAQERAPEIAIRPLADQVLMRKHEEEQRKSKGGIIIPDTAAASQTECLVIAVGPGRITELGQLVEPRVKVGDRVLLGKYSGTYINVRGAEYMLCAESEIKAVLEGV